MFYLFFLTLAAIQSTYVSKYSKRQHKKSKCSPNLCGLQNAREPVQDAKISLFPIIQSQDQNKDEIERPRFKPVLGEKLKLNEQDIKKINRSSHRSYKKGNKKSKKRRSHKKAHKKKQRRSICNCGK